MPRQREGGGKGGRKKRRKRRAIARTAPLIKVDVSRFGRSTGEDRGRRRGEVVE